VTAKPPGDFEDFGVTGFYGLVVNVEATTDAIDYRQAEPAFPAYEMIRLRPVWKV
jgi:hypothetical protein